MCRRALIMPRHFIITLSLVLAHLSALAFAMTCSIDAKDVPGTTGCLSAAAASMYVSIAICCFDPLSFCSCNRSASTL